jgi:hypothetical protein
VQSLLATVAHPEMSRNEVPLGRDTLASATVVRERDYVLAGGVISGRSEDWRRQRACIGWPIATGTCVLVDPAHGDMVLRERLLEC